MILLLHTVPNCCYTVMYISQKIKFKNWIIQWEKNNQFKHLSVGELSILEKHLVCSLLTSLNFAWKVNKCSFNHSTAIFFFSEKWLPRDTTLIHDQWPVYTLKQKCMSYHKISIRWNFYCIHVIADLDCTLINYHKTILYHQIPSS